MKALGWGGAGWGLEKKKKRIYAEGRDAATDLIFKLLRCLSGYRIQAHFRSRRNGYFE